MANIERSNYKYLFNVNSPEDIRKLDVSELPELCRETREYMIDVIAETGGHFGPGLGVVELTVALHYVYNTPVDKLIWDVGHQGYPHKILTGRRDLLPTIRQKGGLSGFLKPQESLYDAFGAGHASTSISAALGIAAARDMRGKDFRVVSVIGDGAMTGGLAFEAMNNCGVQNRDITVVLNDNNASIAPNVSALSNYFNEIYASGAMRKLRDNIWELTGKMDYLGDRIRRLASRFEDGVKAIVTPGVLFEALGFNYFGPISGHNVGKLVRMFERIKDITGPILFHVITTKGKGFAPAENDFHHLHAIGKIDRETGKSLVVSGVRKRPTYSRVFGETLSQLCALDDRIVGVTAAMPDGTGIDVAQEKFPDRIFDVGIAEGHAVTFAAGLANQGMKPVVAIYSTFLQRAYDNIIHDCALQNLSVVFAIDRGGVVGGDGPTHHGVLDLAYLRSIQNMTVMAPKDEAELRDMLYSALFKYANGPVAIRYPRGKVPGVEKRDFEILPYGKSETLKEGEDLAILAIGNTVLKALDAAERLERENISCEVVNARFVKPLDEDMLDDIIDRFDRVITVEDGQIMGGFGSAVLEYVGQTSKKKIDFLIHGIPDRFVEHGAQDALLRDLKLDAEGIAGVVRRFLGLPEKLDGRFEIAIDEKKSQIA